MKFKRTVISLEALTLHLRSAAQGYDDHAKEMRAAMAVGGPSFVPRVPPEEFERRRRECLDWAEALDHAYEAEVSDRLELVLVDYLADIRGAA